MLRFLLAVFFTLYLFSDIASAANCSFYSNDVRRFHYEQFGIDFPYWYSIAQIQKESNCINTLSKDGIGSEGLPQITYRWWAGELKKHNIKDLKTVSNQLKAQAIINKYNYDRLPIKKLYIMYQAYNRNLNTVIKENVEGVYEKGLYRCQTKNLQNICVWKLPNGTCKQYRTNCDINYNYSKTIYQYGQKYKIGQDKIPFF